MNPDFHSPEYQRMVLAERTHSEACSRRRAELHAKAVARRRKAKRGGKR